MTPYIKKIVELHKIHKAIEEKDCCNAGGGDDSSKEITIDDVVKFIHDDLADSPMASSFPYTTWDEIPNYNDVDAGQVCKATSILAQMSFHILNSFSYIIGIKGSIDPI